MLAATNKELARLVQTQRVGPYLPRTIQEELATLTAEETLRARLKALNDYLATCPSKEVADFYISDSLLHELHAYKKLPAKVSEDQQVET